MRAGNIFERSGDKALELKRICLGATGSAVAQGPNQAERAFSFFDLKGDVENLLHRVREQVALFRCALVAEYYRPGVAARAVLDGATVAQFGQIHPEVAAARKLRQEVFVAEIYLDRLYKHALRQGRYEALPRYPAVERDFSFVFADSVVFERISQAVRGLGISELREFLPVEIFRGGSIPAGKYSIVAAGLVSVRRADSAGG